MTISTDKLLIYNSRWKNVFTTIFLSVLSCAGLAVIFHVLAYGPAQPFNISNIIIFSGILLATIFCCIGAFYFGKRMLNPEPVIILDEHGILSHDAPFGLIPWSEISSVSAFWSKPSIVQFDVLKLTLISPEKWFRYLPRYAQRIKAITESMTIRVNFINTTTLSVLEAAKYAKQRISAR